MRKAAQSPRALRSRFSAKVLPKSVARWLTCGPSWRLTFSLAKVTCRDEWLLQGVRGRVVAGRGGSALFVLRVLRGAEPAEDLLTPSSLPAHSVQELCSSPFIPPFVLQRLFLPPSTLYCTRVHVCAKKVFLCARLSSRLVSLNRNLLLIVVIFKSNKS